MLRLAARRTVGRLFRVTQRDASNMSMDVTPTGVAIVRLDCAGEKQNTLSTELMDEFDAMCTRVETDPEIKAAVLISAKKDSWIAGANIKMIESLTTAEEASAAAEAGQKAMDRIEAMQSKTPWVAAIDGACLGGGLELALACAHRIVTTSSKSVLGLPEVQLGLLPGSGGTQRLPKVVGMPTALDMMLTGKNIKPTRAKKMGLVDLVVDPTALERNAVLYAEGAANGVNKPRVRKPSWMDAALEQTPMGRNMMFNTAKKGVMKATKGKMPAPLRILDVARVGIESGHTVGSESEREHFGGLAATAESKALRGLFFGITETKKHTYGKPSLDVSTVGVLGAGLMGAGIAEVTATKGLQVLLKDTTLAGLTRGEAMIAKNFGNKLKKKRMTKYEHDVALARVVGLTDDTKSYPRHFANANVVIEAVFEEMSVKHKVVEQLEAVCAENCIIASNTSTLPIGEIAMHAKRPQNIVGMHYFSPVDKMPLLEVIPHETTDEAVVAAAIELGQKQGKTVIAVKDVPGFYVNRCLGPLLCEALALVQQGFDPLKLNQGMMDFGFPVGGITLADEVGIDVSKHVVGNLVGEKPKFLGERMGGADLTMLSAFVEAGLLGRKSGAGFYDYSAPEPKKQPWDPLLKAVGMGPKGGKGKPINPKALEIVAKFRSPDKDSSALPVEDAIERVVYRFLIEAVHCLQSGVIATPRDGDVGAVMGIGFPPFRGGPFMYLDQMGAAPTVEKMKALQAEHGDHFAPPELLVEMAKDGKTFY